MPQEINRRLVWAPRARRDLNALWVYLAEVASSPVADSLVSEIDGTLSRLRERPFVGRPRDDIHRGMRSVIVRPYAIYYRVHDRSIEIVRILHQRRDIRKAFRTR